MESIIIAQTVIIIYLMWTGLLKSFKVSYYEQTLKNNKHKFSEERYKGIENVMAKKNPFSQ